jgi:hypothetical protein
MGLPFSLKMVRAQQSCSNLRTGTFTKANKGRLACSNPKYQRGVLRPKSKEWRGKSMVGQASATCVAPPAPFLFQTLAWQERESNLPGTPLTGANTNEFQSKARAGWASFVLGRRAGW